MLGAVTLPLAWKTSRIIYRIAPYLYPSAKLKKTKEQLVVIAGATDGIGLEYLRRLSPEYSVVAMGRNAAKLSQLKENHPNIHTLHIDFTNNVCNELAVEQTNKAIAALAR